VTLLEELKVSGTNGMKLRHKSYQDVRFYSEKPLFHDNVGYCSHIILWSSGDAILNWSSGDAILNS
jgi:hypothetical protein